MKNPLTLKFVLFFALCLCGNLAFAAETEITTFDSDLSEQGIATAYSDADLERLFTKVLSHVDSFLSDKASSKKADKYILLKNWLQERGELLASGTLSAADREVLFANLRNILYSLMADENGHRKSSLSEKLAILKQVIFSSIELPYLAPANRSTGILPEQAKLEASHLVDSQSGKEYVSNSELTGLSVNQIADLDLREDDALWYSKKTLAEIKSKNGSAWNYLVKSLESATSKSLGLHYEMQKARRVLILDKLKDTATSAKVETKDIYGQKWKLKWGDEIHSEPIANRIYVELGGKFTDLVFANKGGRKDLILILGSKKEDTCEKISSLKMFQSCLLSSVYKFDVSPYIVEAGTLTQEMATQELKKYDLPNADIKKLINRDYIVFNESLVEFQPSDSIVGRYGAVSMNSPNAIESRAKRAMVLYSYFIKNKDAKDDNNKSIVFNNHYIEFYHDLGASLAGIASNADANHIEPAFVYPHGDKVTLDLASFFVPAAYKQASISDQLWMAQKIAALSLAEIQEAVSATRWPTFQQNVILSRLLGRRNNVVEAYGLNAPLLKLNPESDKSEERSLKTPEDRMNVVREFNMALQWGSETKALAHLENTMKLAEIHFNSKNGTGYTDKLTRFKNGIGKTNSCHNSIIISALESSVNPTGISRRAKRFNDNHALPACYPMRRKMR